MVDHIVRRVLSADPRRRVRLLQWATTFTVYLFSALVMAFGVRQGLVSQPAFIGWCAFVALALAVFYAAIRSGWSERFADPALTDVQILFGVITVMWGYMMCGAVRSATLYPLFMILTFGAFSSSWQRITALTVFALLSLVASIVALQQLAPADHDLRVDLANLLITSIILPTGSWITARLAGLREKLKGQRAELARALAEVQRLATRDELTGLNNRRQMQELMELEHQRCVRSGRTFCLVMIDLDHFKQINDAHGHAAGDALLAAFADEALADIRVSDVISRWGGEEFLMMATDARGSAARLGVERLRERVQRMRVPFGDGELRITLSAGVAEHIAGESIPEAIARADAALYAAKARGRNCVVVA